jgi:hypothetical protein
MSVWISFCALDMLPDEFPQSGYHVWTFPRFAGSPLGTSPELPYLWSSTELRWMSSGLHSDIWGMYSGKGHSAQAEAKPFLP